MSEKAREGEFSTFRLTYHEGEFPAALDCAQDEPIQNLTKEQMHTIINHLPPEEARKDMKEGLRMLNHVLEQGGPKALISFVAVGRHYLKEGKVLHFDFARMKRDQESFRRNLQQHDPKQFSPGDVEDYKIPPPEALEKGLRGMPMDRKKFFTYGVGGLCAFAWGIPGAIDLTDRLVSSEPADGKEDPRHGPEWVKKIRPVSTYVKGLPGELAEVGIAAYFINDAIDHFLYSRKEWKEAQFEQISNAIAIAAQVLGIQPELHYNIDQRPASPPRS